MATNYSPAGQAALDSKIQGLRAAKAAFQALPEVFRNGLNEATFITTSEIARQAKAFVLASPSVRTRSLYNAIGFTTNDKLGRGRVGIMNITTTINVGGKNVRVRGNLVGRPGGRSLASSVRAIIPRRYAHLIEFGARHFPAEPFMLPAVEREKPHYLERCRAAGRRAEETLARIGGRNL